MGKRFDWDDDGALLGSADPDAFAQVYDRYAPAILRFLLVRTACPQSAADLAAETFAVALQIRHRYDPARGSAKGWLMGIAMNQLRHYLRRGRVSARALHRLGVRIEWDEADLAQVEQYLDTLALQTKVRARLADLTPALRTAVELRVMRQLSYDEVAVLLDCSPGAARVRVARALAVLSRDEELLSDWATATAVTSARGDLS